MTSTAAARLEAAMVDECTITRATPIVGNAAYDRGTGNLTPPPPVTVYEGRCMFTEVNAVVQTTERGGAQEHVARYQVSVPLDAGPVAIGDVVTMTRCDADADIVDQKLTVRKVSSGTRVARRKLACDLVEAGPRI